MFTGDAVTTAFTLSRTPASVTSILVFIDGVKQSSTSGAYTLLGTTLSFAVAPPNGDGIEVIHLGVQSLVNVPSSATITASALAPELRAVVADQFTANGTGTTFVLTTTPISSNSVIVTADGVVQYDYSISGSTLILNFIPTNGTLIRAAGMGNILTTGTITDDSVSTAKLQLNSVTTAKIADGSVTGVKLGLTSINANNIVDGSVTGVKLGLTSINANNIVDNSITSAKLDTSIFATTSNIFGVTANSNTFSNTIIIVAGNTAPINVGMLVSGSNVTPGTTVLSFNSSPPSGRSNITLSAATVGTNTNTAFSFYEANKVLSPGIAGPGLCKAWVNFNGTGAVQIRAAYNVSSITDNGTGDYTVNFTTAMPDANYSRVVSAGTGAATSGYSTGLSSISTTSFGIGTVLNGGSNAIQDVAYVMAAVFR